ncbi:protein RfbU [Geobacter sp. OR-1]|uniref:glycosyltransferase family 4 protein n=1 Tax=Geobacter sp. OR-1 TaxID=1266765 RepID=UPI0005422B85|nr:glycosyltransferase family 1 protein [Geobacter sp. OR-1]GAM08234.1 protein RfbU [Geobacter sp. OR-1]
MIIYLNGRFLTQSITGVQRYAHEVIKALDELIASGKIDASGYNFELLVPPDVEELPDYRAVSVRSVGRLTGHYWEQFELPFHSRDGVLVSLTNAAPLFKRNQVVTIHDAAVFAFPEAYSFFFRLWYRVLMKLLGRIARMIITVSNFSCNELITYCSINTEKIRVIYEGKEHITATPADEHILKQYNLASRKYVLASGSTNPNKNIQSVIAAVKLLGHTDIKVVVAGGANPKVFKLSQAHEADNIVNVGYVNDGELRALYEHALCLVYPSFYEGFGLPPLEAQACGCPVIVSSAASLPEVCQGAALFCNPYDATDIVASIRRLIFEPGLREEMRRNGLEKAERLSWTACASSIFDALGEIG